MYIGNCNVISLAVVFNDMIQLIENFLFKYFSADGLCVDTVHSSCLIRGTLQAVILNDL